MRILLLGKDGQVGWELHRSLSVLGELVALGRNGKGEYCGDLAQPERLANTVRTLAPDVIVNAAAYTAVDKAESEPDLAMRVNGAAPGILAREAKRLGALLVHYSTDYVFDGTRPTAYSETDEPNPLNAYGRTKLAGEHAIQASGCDHLIFRTSWVYAARGGNFAKTMLRLARERDSLRVIADQRGAPTSAELIADATTQAVVQARLNPRLLGLYHLVAGGETSWHGYACHVLSVTREHGVPLKVSPEAVEAIATAEYPLPAQRPANSRLDTQKLCHAFGLYMPDWRVHVNRMLQEVLETNR